MQPSRPPNMENTSDNMLATFETRKISRKESPPPSFLPLYTEKFRHYFPLNPLQVIFKHTAPFWVSEFLTFSVYLGYYH